ncbi:MAG: hypothetical protein IPO40_09020 [Fibrobacteres bacterium]|nr:hypothetical protein [Fibrobacterota bacterium]
MKNPLVRTVATCLGLLALQSTSALAAVPCDASWVGTAISSAPSTLGNLSVLRGSDGVIRANEWLDGSKAWSGWFNLPSQDASLIGDPWVQFVSNPGSSFAAQNIFATGSTYIKQWVLTRSNGNWTIANKSINSSSGSAKVVGRVTSAQMTSTTSSKAGDQIMIATFSDGKVRSQNWIVSTLDNGAWDGIWTDLKVPGGAPNVVSSPYAVQLTQNTVNLFVRVNGILYQKYWNGSNWWGYGTDGWVPVTAGEAPFQGDPTSVYSEGTNVHFLHLFSGQYESYHTVGKYYGGWTYGSDYSLTLKKSLAPVNSPNNTRTVYGIDAANAVWRYVYDNTGEMTSPMAYSRANCLQPYDGP